MKRSHFFTCVLSSFMMLHSLIAWAQSDTGGSDLGTEPGLPAEAPATPFAAPTPQSVKPSPGRTLPAPVSEGAVQPYEGAPNPNQRAAPAAKQRPAITGKLAELNLSAEQAQQIVEIRRQAKPEVEKRLKEEFLFFKQNLAQAMADDSNGEEIRRRFELMQKKYLELQTLKFEKLLRVREVLTPEQRKKFAELRSRPASRNANDND